ncbi:MAG: hypothetical protein AB8H86_08320 [Polyangiales bacterium]
MLCRYLCLMSLLCALIGCGDDATTDVGSPDSGSRDGGALDAAAEDAAAEDAAAEDAASEDASAPDAGADAGGDAGAADGGPDAGPPPICTTSDDCGGDPCFLFPDGTRDCVVDPGDPPREACAGGGFPCGCSADSECGDGSGGVCIAFTHRYCGGAPPPPINECRYDACSEDADCDERAMGACVPRGEGGFTNTCAYGSCRTSADCREGGTCDRYDNGCGAGGGTLFCRYADDVCSDTVPCPPGPAPMLCVPAEDGHGTECIPDLPRP